jgi:hypothetical protein
MHLPTRVNFVCVAVLLGACSTVDATSPTAASLRRSAPSFEVTTIDGEEFYEEESSGDLVPTGSQSARISNPASSASVSCNNDSCNGSFSAYHEGMWHWTEQGMHWKMFDADNNSVISSGDETKTGGTGCGEWLTLFCTKKTQANSHSALNMSTYSCRVGVLEQTDHRAGWGKFAVPIPGGWQIQIGNSGEVSVTSKATGLDTGNCGPCDDPMTDTIEQCDPDNPPPPSTKIEGFAYGPVAEPSGHEPTAPGSHWVCWFTDWFQSTNGGPWIYTDTGPAHDCYLEED